MRCSILYDDMSNLICMTINLSTYLSVKHEFSFSFTLFKSYFNVMVFYIINTIMF